MEYKEIFANSFKEKKLSKSTNQIAKECGIPQQTLSEYENANREIKLTNLWILADYFDITVDELIGRK